MAVGTAGEFRLWGWVQAVNGASNSFYAKVDDGVASPWHLPMTEVFAPASAPNVYTLAAGEHTVIIYLRESGAKLDRHCNGDS